MCEKFLAHSRQCISTDILSLLLDNIIEKYYVPGIAQSSEERTGEGRRQRQKTLAQPPGVTSACMSAGG